MHPYEGRPPMSPAGSMHGDNHRQIHGRTAPTAATQHDQAARPPSTSRLRGRFDSRVNFAPPKVAVRPAANSIPASTMQQSLLSTTSGTGSYTGLPQRTNQELNSQGELKPQILPGHCTNALINAGIQTVGILDASLNRISKKRNLDQLHGNIADPRQVKKPMLCQTDQTTNNASQTNYRAHPNLQRQEKMKEMKRERADGRQRDSSLISRKSSESIYLEIRENLKKICEGVKLAISLCSKLQNVGVGAAQLKNENRANQNQRKRKNPFAEEQHLTFTEHFDVEKIERHIHSLKECAAQDKKKIRTSEDQRLELDHKPCTLCGEGSLLFDPPSKSCSNCEKLIGLNVVYYKSASKYTCAVCYSNLRAKINGVPTEKGEMIKMTNNVAAQEPMVRCSKCKTWQHNICCLLNTKRRGEYICLSCRMKMIEKGESSLSPKCTVNAENLTACNLSDFLQSRLQTSLERERRERAKQLKEPNIERVETAENLTIKVLASSDHVLTVPTRLLKIFNGKYPSEFAYRSKAVGLFQKIEGVDVLLFVMYVQEYGSDCPPPNQRHINLSYIDSVKHFIPNTLTADKEPLRSFVYQEILIGYLDYAKKRGFNTCYIWASPPLKSDSYILYSHPMTQKIPNTGQLCKWYQNMIKKAIDEKTVEGMTYIYDQYFGSSTKSQKNVTMASLPFFDGDYFHKAIVDCIQEYENEQSDAPQKITSLTSRKAAEFDTDSRNKLAQASIMEKIGEKIKKDKKTFILVHLRPVCASCSRIILPQKRWQGFQSGTSVCDSCYKERESKIKNNNLYKILKEDKFSLVQNEVCSDTTDKDKLMPSEIFDSRFSFLSFCENNNYQFDSLRRAKHSTMMCLYEVLNSMTT